MIMEVRQGRILVVDDEALAADLLREILVAEGYQGVETVVDPQTAIARFREFQPDLVVLDWIIPPLSGAELLRAIRAESIRESIYRFSS